MCEIKDINSKNGHRIFLRNDFQLILSTILIYKAEYIFTFLSVGVSISKAQFLELYNLGEMLGKGGFGVVFAGIRITDQVK